MRFSRSTHQLLSLSSETLTSIIRTGSPIQEELIGLANSYNFYISNDLPQMVSFPTRIPDCDCYNPALLDLFRLVLVFVLQWLSLYWEILIIMLSQFPLTVCETQKGDAPFHRIAYDCSHTDEEGLGDQMFYGIISLNLCFYCYWRIL